MFAFVKSSDVRFFPNSGRRGLLDHLVGFGEPPGDPDRVTLGLK